MATIVTTKCFTPASEIPALAAALSWARLEDGTYEKTFTSLNNARKIYRENHRRDRVPEYGYIILDSSHRGHGIFAW